MVPIMISFKASWRASPIIALTIPKPAIKEEILNPDAIAVFILRKLYELYPERLEKRYGVVELDEDLIEVYDTIAKRRGALSRGGVADYDKVSNIIIRDLKNGYFGNITFDRLDVKK